MITGQLGGRVTGCAVTDTARFDQRDLFTALMQFVCGRHAEYTTADNADVVSAGRTHRVIKGEPAIKSAGGFVLLLKLFDDGFGKVCGHLIVV